MCVHVRPVLSGTVAWAPRPRNFPGKNTRVGCHFLLEGTFLIQGLNLCLLGLLHWQADSGPPGKPKQRAINTDTRRPDQPSANGDVGLLLPPAGDHWNLAEEPAGGGVLSTRRSRGPTCLCLAPSGGYTIVSATRCGGSGHKVGRQVLLVTVLLVSDAQHNDLIFFFLQIIFHIGYYKTPGIIPCATR